MRALKTLRRFYEEESHVVITEAGSPPRAISSVGFFRLEVLPPGPGVISPRPPLERVPTPRAAFRGAITPPEESEPLPARLKPGMKVTVALDDISLPLPP